MLTTLRLPSKIYSPEIDWNRQIAFPISFLFVHSVDLFGILRVILFDLLMFTFGSVSQRCHRESTGFLGELFDF